MSAERTAYILLAIAFFGSLILGMSEMFGEDGRVAWLFTAGLAGFGLEVVEYIETVGGRKEQ